MKGTALQPSSAYHWLWGEKKKKEWNIYTAPCISETLNVARPPRKQSAPSTPCFQKNENNKNLNSYFWQSITFPES